MTPSYAPFSPVDGAFVYSVSCGKNNGRFIASADRGDIGSGQFGRAVLLAFGRTFWMKRHSTGVSPLSVTISDVIGWRPDKEMGRVAARRVVAAMANMQSGRNRPVGLFPRETLAVDVPPVDPDNAIAKGMMGLALPWPALIRATTVNLRPEARDTFGLGQSILVTGGAARRAKSVPTNSEPSRARPERNPTCFADSWDKLLFSHSTSKGSVVRDRERFTPFSVPSSLAQRRSA